MLEENGHFIFQDRHSTGHKVPLIDASQDYTLLHGYQNDTHTILRFSRLWDTCDKVSLIPLHKISFDILPHYVIFATILTFEI